MLVAGDELGIVEVVAGIHAHALGEAPAHGDLLLLRQQRDLDAVDLVGMVGDDRRGRSRIAAHVIGRAPIAGQRRIEHFAEPMDDHRLLHLAEDAVIDARVVVGAARGPGQRPARHQDDAAAEPFDRLDLLLIGADDVVDASSGARHRDGRCRRRRRSARRGAPSAAVERAADQLARRRPVEAHAALGGVHRLGDAEAEVPEMMRGRRWSRPSRSPARARDRCRRADRPRHGRPSRRCG